MGRLQLVEQNRCDAWFGNVHRAQTIITVTMAIRPLKRVTAPGRNEGSNLARSVAASSLARHAPVQSSSNLIDLSISSKSVFNFFMVLSGPTILM